jgi:hypothetical protein
MVVGGKKAGDYLTDVPVEDTGTNYDDLNTPEEEDEE